MAYGARLESVLGASPRGFESPILRHRTPGPLQVPGFLLPVMPLVFRAPSGPAALMGRAAVCAGGRRPAREPSAPRASLGASPRSPARPRRRPPAPRQVPPAPSTPAALVLLGLARPGPATAHRHRGQALRTLRSPPHRRCLWCCAHRPVIGRLLPGCAPAASLLDSEALDDLCARERGQDLTRHKELRSAQARADAAPSDRARRVDQEPP